MMSEPVAPNVQPEKPTMDQVLEQPDGGAVATAPTTGEQPAQDDDVPDDIPPKIREAIKAVPDQRIRKQIAEDHYQLRAYKKIAPTVDVLESLAEAAAQANDLNYAFTSADPGYIAKFAEVLENGSKNGWKALTNHVLETLEEKDEEAFTRMGEKFGKNMVFNAMAEAKKSGNEDLFNIAKAFGEWLGVFDQGDQEDELPPKYKREVEEARRLKEEMKRRGEKSQLKNAERFATYVRENAASAVSNDVNSLVEERAADYPEEAREEIKNRIGNELYKAIVKNRPIMDAAGRFARAGDAEKTVQHLVRQAQVLLPHIAEPVFKHYNKMFSGAMQKRTERVEGTPQRRDVGNFSSAAPPPSRPTSGKGKSMDDVLKEFGL